MKIKAIIDEDFVNYKKPSMFIGTAYCDFKCCKEAGIDITVCQNAELAQYPAYDIAFDALYKRYTTNPITSTVVLGGLEPFLQYDDILGLIKYFRKHNCNDTFVIYTGYTLDELIQMNYINDLKQQTNIVLKVGRFIPNSTSRYDSVLGITLISSNQKGVILSE